MIKEIIYFISDYIAVYERYEDTLGKKSLIDKLTDLHHELLDIAERNADNFQTFMMECEEKDILNRFNKIVKKCQKEFKKHI